MADGFPGSSPRWLCSHRGPSAGENHSDGKAQVTREPTGHPAADGAWGPPGPPRPRPSRAGSGPFPGAVTGPIPRVPVTHGQPDDDPWSGTAPGFEFEHRRPRPARGPHQPPPGQPGHGRVPRAHPAPPAAESRRFRYTPTVSQPTSMQAPPQAWPDDDVFIPPGFEFGEPTGPGAGFPAPPRPAPGRPAAGPGAGPGPAGRPAPNGLACSARCCPSRPGAAGPGSS